MDVTKLRVGLLLDGPSAPAYLYDVIRDLVDCAHVDIVLAIVSSNGGTDSAPRGSEFFFKKHRSSPRLLHDAIRKGLWALYSTHLERPSRLPNVDKLKSLDSLLAQVPKLLVHPPAHGRHGQYSDADLEAVRSHELDLIFHAGSGSMAGELTRCARHGVWSFQSSLTDRDGLPLIACWESIRNSAVTESRLSMFKDDSETGTVLQRSWSCTYGMSIQRNRNKVLSKTSGFVTRKLRELLEVGEEEFFRRVDLNDQAPGSPTELCRDVPGTLELTRLTFKKIQDKIKILLGSLNHFEQWILMFDFRDSPATSLSGFRRITPPKDRFWADPFLLRRQGRNYIFLEEFPYAADKGHISVMEIDEEGSFTPPQTIVDQPYHMSYPSLFEYGEDLFMIPESAANRTIEVYKCLEFPHRWELEKILMQDLHAVDTTLFEHDETWWMFVNLSERPGASADDELFLFFADSPLSNDWTPHPQNPIVSDVRTARPAGNIFEWQGKIYRPSQVCAPIYGSGLNLNHIEVLTRESYREKVAWTADPDWARDLIGLHTFNRAGRLHVIDGLSWRRK